MTGTWTLLERRIPKGKVLTAAAHERSATHPDVKVRLTWARRPDAPPELLATRAGVEADPRVLAAIAARVPASHLQLLLDDPRTPVAFAAAENPACTDEQAAAVITRILRRSTGKRRAVGQKDAFALAAHFISRGLVHARPATIEALLREVDVTAMHYMVAYVEDPDHHAIVAARLRELLATGELNLDLLARWPAPAPMAEELAEEIAARQRAGTHPSDPYWGSWLNPTTQTLAAAYQLVAMGARGPRGYGWLLDMARFERREAALAALVEMTQQDPAGGPSAPQSQHPQDPKVRFQASLAEALAGNAWAPPTVIADLLARSRAHRDAYRKNIGGKHPSGRRAANALKTAVELDEPGAVYELVRQVKELGTLHLMAAATGPRAPWPRLLDNPAADLALALTAPVREAAHFFHDPLALHDWLAEQMPAGVDVNTLDRLLSGFHGTAEDLLTVAPALVA